MNDERSRVAAFLDLAEGRGPVALLDEAGIGELLQTARRIAVIGRLSGPEPAVVRRLPHPRRQQATTACRSTRTRPRSSAPARSRRSRRPPRRPARSTSSTSSAARSCASRTPKRPWRVAARCLWLQLGVVNWEAARIAAAAGLSVVMDRCTAIELRRIAAGRPPLSGWRSPPRTAIRPIMPRVRPRSGPWPQAKDRHRDRCARRAGVLADAAAPRLVAGRHWRPGP